jgi:hypothetical protein
LIFFNLLNLFWHTDKNFCFYAEVNFWYLTARPWMLAHLKIIWQFHQKVSRFFGPRYIGDDFFLGPNLVSLNRAVVPLFELFKNVHFKSKKSLPTPILCIKIKEFYWFWKFVYIAYFVIALYANFCNKLLVILIKGNLCVYCK